MSETELKSVGTIMGPYGIDVNWTPESTPEQREAAQSFIKEAMEAVNSDEEALPKSIASITIRRV